MATAAFGTPWGRMRGAATRRWGSIVKEQQQNRRPHAARTRRAQGGCGLMRRCSSSAMATHRFLLAPCLRPQAPCARPLRFPGQAPRARSAPRGRGAAAALALGLVLAWPGGGAAASPHGAAEAGDATACAAALDRFAASILAPVLSARLREARQAIGRARTAMVRNDMAMGRTEVGAARRALDGLRYAGALSRALFALQIGS